MGPTTKIRKIEVPGAWDEVGTSLRNLYRTPLEGDAQLTKEGVSKRKGKQSEAKAKAKAKAAAKAAGTASSSVTTHAGTENEPNWDVIGKHIRR